MLRYRIFEDAKELCEWVNDYKIKVISISHKQFGYLDKYKQEYVLFYEEK